MAFQLLVLLEDVRFFHLDAEFVPVAVQLLVLLDDDLLSRSDAAIVPLPVQLLGLYVEQSCVVDSIFAVAGVVLPW